MRKRLFKLCLLCLTAATVVMVAANCGGSRRPPPVVTAEPPLMTSPLASPQGVPTMPLRTNEDPSFTVSNCLVEKQLLPYPCGIIPGRTTVEAVPSLLGKPWEVYPRERCWYALDVPNKWDITACASFDHLMIFLGDAVVVGLNVWPSEFTLGGAIEILGPPERVLLGYVFDSSLPGWEEGRSNQVHFFWPARGIYLSTRFYGTTGVGLDEEPPPFPAELPINSLIAFEPCTVEEIESGWRNYIYNRWVEWPGLQAE